MASRSGPGPDKGEKSAQAQKSNAAAHWGKSNIPERPKQSPSNPSKSHASGSNTATPKKSTKSAATTGDAPSKGLKGSGDSATESHSAPAEASYTKHGNLEPEEPPTVYAAQPDIGTAGPKHKIRANMLKLEIGKQNQSFFVYSLSFPPINKRTVKNRNMKKDLIQEVLLQQPFKDQAKHLATDWTTLIVSTVDLSAHHDSLQLGSSLDLTVSWRNQTGGVPQDLVINVALVHVLSLQDLKAYCDANGNTNIAPHLTALNILARKVATHPHPNRDVVVKVGRDKFFWQREMQSQQHSVRWPSCLQPRAGYFSSALAFRNGLAINMHNVTTAFITPTWLLDYAEAQISGFKRRLADPSDYNSRFKSTISQLQVRFAYIPPDPEADYWTPKPLLTAPCSAGRLRRVNGFGKSASREVFRHSQHGDITVEKYYNRYVLPSNSQLKHPNLLVINVGSQESKVWVPAELLYIEAHQPLRGQISDNDMRRMLDVAQKTPIANANAIESAVGTGGIFDRRLDFANLGLDINPHMMVADARKLPIPDLLYYGKVRARAQNDNLWQGKWNLMGKKLRAGTQLSTLGVLKIGAELDDPKLYDDFANNLRACGVSNKGNKPAVQMYKAHDHTAASLKSAYDKFSDKVKQAGVILVGLPGSEKLFDEYAAIKNSFDTIHGIKTVCVTGKNLKQLSNKAFSANLALKFNVKLGGINHVLDEQAEEELHTDEGNTMVVGADVTHPGVGAVSYCPSIAAVVASCDRTAITYPGSMRLQRSKQEEIDDLSGMMEERLALWAQTNNGKLPTDILFYRDGVSDSQFSMVKTKELPKIRAGCDRAGQNANLPDYNPNITLIVCGKRHHTRFFPPAPNQPKVPRDWLDNNQNFNPGLVVDDVAIRNPYTFDFYLQSHRALKGTARPCHYFVIENESEWTSDDLQRSTFNLCWIFATALTPISYAAPAYYADRLCERGRRYLWPLLRSHHPQRPSDDDELLKGMHSHYTVNMTRDEAHNWQATEDQKRDWALQQTLLARNRFWPYRSDSKNPQAKELDDVMYYV